VFEEVTGGEARHADDKASSSSNVIVHPSNGIDADAMV
jgi:hypothetical protein